MSDAGKYEFWDYRSKESSAQFRAYKELRSTLLPYESYFDELLRIKTAQEINLKGKAKSKFEFKVEDGEREHIIEIKAHKSEGEIMCKEVWFKTADYSSWAWIDFDKEGKIKKITIDGQYDSDTRVKISQVLSLLELGKPNVGIGGFPEDKSPVKHLEFDTEEPTVLGFYAYASYGEGRLWRSTIDKNGEVAMSKIPFKDLVSITLDRTLPQSTVQEIKNPRPLRRIK